jgi:flavodoxin
MVGISEANAELGNVLVVFYSRTGTTMKVAEAIREALGCEIDGVEDTKGRSGVIG